MTDYITRLLEGESVEWRTLGEVCELRTGLNPRKFFKLNTEDAQNFYITIRELKGGKITPDKKTDLINEKALRLCQNRSKLEKGDLLFSGTGTIGTMAVVESEPTNWNIKEGVYALKPLHGDITVRYLYYILSTESYQQDFQNRAIGGTVRSIPMRDLAKITIPVPPMRVQERIVEVLDQLTELHDELIEKLENEMEGRRRQYAYYREKLLSFNNVNTEGGGIINVKYLPLGEVCELKRGARVTKAELNPTKTYPVYSGGTKPMGYYDHANQEANTVTVVKYGTAGYVNFITESFWANDVCYCLKPKEGLSNKYLYYYLCSKQQDLYDLATDAIPAHLPPDELRSITIPIPPLEEQERIVEVLDRFSTLCESITEGLPREIELRRKQYEYYREQLLTFPHP